MSQLQPLLTVSWKKAIITRVLPATASYLGVEEPGRKAFSSGKNTTSGGE